ncbi:MAG: hypothetical protein BWY42_01134 [Candidatus Omnitrophica bacterium ADurb.Bin277]|nr:MAG: hypothetical protein BWY42_01134 [Candidatus Omnitrophica bacterium ADurb.Bin277]
MGRDHDIGFIFVDHHARFVMHGLPQKIMSVHSRSRASDKNIPRPDIARVGRHLVEITLGIPVDPFKNGHITKNIF